MQLTGARSVRSIQLTFVLTMFFKMRQCSVFKSIRNSLSTDGLLSYTWNHLRNIDEWTYKIKHILVFALIFFTYLSKIFHFIPINRQMISNILIWKCACKFLIITFQHLNNKKLFTLKLFFYFTVKLKISYS